MLFADISIEEIQPSFDVVPPKILPSRKGKADSKEVPCKTLQTNSRLHWMMGIQEDVGAHFL